MVLTVAQPWLPCAQCRVQGASWSSQGHGQGKSVSGWDCSHRPGHPHGLWMAAGRDMLWIRCREVTGVTIVAFGKHRGTSSWVEVLTGSVSRDLLDCGWCTSQPQHLSTTLVRFPSIGGRLARQWGNTAWCFQHFTGHAMSFLKNTLDESCS